MQVKDQIEQIKHIGDNLPFSEKIKEDHKSPLKANKIEILQINIGKRCNLHCKHCHVEAGPTRTEIMSKDILEKCLDILINSDISTIDITGGAPEMNPNLEWFITEVSKLNRRLIIRSNLVILLEPEYKKFIDIYTDNKVEVVTSLPDYVEDKSERQRGSGTFHKALEVIKILNQKGYGQKNSDLVLDIVHNPVGAYLPGSQSGLEHEYHHQLKNKYDIEFNTLFCITNIPIGRYLEYLIKSGNYEDYINELINAYNPNAVDNVMCKSTLSVGWDGKLYDCDFNQMLELPVDHGAPDEIKDFDLIKLNKREIMINNHCYGCVAGSGSSCQGATT